MEQYNKIVLEAPKEMHYTTSQGENGELIVRLVPNSPASSQESTTCTQSQEVEDKAKYFTKISAKEREKVKNWLATQGNAPGWATEFLKIIGNALKVVDYDYWIANLEPSIKGGKIHYAKGEEIRTEFSCNDWYALAKNYAPERGSRLSTIYELFIWYALRITDGLWTLEYVTKDSSSAGNYSDAPNSTHNMEKTGARQCGGYCDGQGNTCKIVTIENCYVRVGGGYFMNGKTHTVVYAFLISQANASCHSCGSVVFTK